MKTEVQQRLKAWMQRYDNASGNLVGIEIGGTKIQAICLSAEGELIDHQRAKAEPEGGARSILQALESIVCNVKKNVGHIETMGVGFGGIVDWKTGVTKGSFQVRGWENYPLSEWLGEQSGASRVFVENDTNAATYAESVVGNGVEFSHVLYSNSGSGVGAGFTIHRELLRGSSDFEMELGHLRVGELLGPLQEFCSGWSLDARIRSLLEREPESDFAQRVQRQHLHGNFLGKAFDHLVLEQHPKALQILNDVARNYALGLSHAAYLLNPSVIILGGGVALMGEPWSTAIDRHLREFMDVPLVDPPEVRLSILGEYVVPIGAALLALKRTYPSFISNSVYKSEPPVAADPR